jgi:DNA replication protein DnaC
VRSSRRDRRELGRYQRRLERVDVLILYEVGFVPFGGDEKLTTTLLDRLAEAATVITTRGESFRTKKRHAQPSPSPQP